MSPAGAAAAERVERALGSESARVRRWAIDRLRAGLEESEGADLAPRPPYPDSLRRVITARMEALADAAAGAGEDAEGEDDPALPDGTEEVDLDVRDLLHVALGAGIHEAIPAIEALLATSRSVTIDLLTDGAEALAHLGARGARAGDAVRTALEKLLRVLDPEGPAVKPDLADRLADLRRSISRSVLSSLLRIEGARHVAAAFEAVVDALLAPSDGEGAMTFERFAPLLDGIHEAAGLRGAVSAVALILDAGEAPRELAGAVPADALLHARKRSTPKLVRVAVHALRPLVGAAGAGAEVATAATGTPQTTATANLVDSDPLSGARAVVREGLRLREKIEAVRGDRARLIAVLLLAARAKITGALPASIDEAARAHRAAAAPVPATAPRDRVESPAEARAHVASALEVILDADRGYGPPLEDARRVVVALGDAALPAVLERLDLEAARASPGAATGDVGELADLVARLGTRAAADALLERFDRLCRADRESLFHASLTLADPRFLAPIIAEHRPGETLVEATCVALAELSGADDPRVAAMHETVRAREAVHAEEGAYPGSTGAALDALRRGEPATLDLDLACEACGRTYTYRVTQALIVSDDEVAQEPRHVRPAGGLKRVRLPEREEDDLLVVLDEVVCKGCGARDRSRATTDALVTAEHLLGSIADRIEDDLADVEPEHCPVREGHAADLLTPEEWPLDRPLDQALLRRKFRERLAAFRADEKEGDRDARWPPELDDAWPTEG